MSEDVGKPKRRGRPPLAAGEKKRITMTFRAREEMRDRLAALALSNNRSISEEIEHQLEVAHNRDAYSQKIVRDRINKIVADEWKKGNEDRVREWIDVMRKERIEKIQMATESIEENLRQLKSYMKDFEEK